LKSRYLLGVICTDGEASKPSKHDELEMSVLWCDRLAGKRYNPAYVKLSLGPRYTTYTHQIVHRVFRRPSIHRVRYSSQETSLDCDQSNVQAYSSRASFSFVFFKSFFVLFGLY